MAKVKPSPLHAEIRGRVGVLVYRKTRHGTIASVRPTRTKPWSAQQKAIRGKMARAAASFYHKTKDDPVLGPHYRARAKARGIPVSAFVMGGFMKHGPKFHELAGPGTIPGSEQLGPDIDDAEPAPAPARAAKRSAAHATRAAAVTGAPRTPRIAIEYCTQCRWLLRAAWMAQELLTTFATEIGEVALIPGQGGVFEIRAGETLLWSRIADGGFPEIKVLKQRVRDHIAPKKDLGHSDRKRRRKR